MKKRINYTDKLVEYAYPSSTTATKYGFADKGCWFVSLYEATSWERKILQAFATKAEAYAYAEGLPNSWHYLHRDEHTRSFNKSNII